RPCGRVGRPDRPFGMRDAPPGEHADLQRLETNEQCAQRFRRFRAKAGGSGAERPKRTGRAPHPDVTQPLEAEQRRRGDQDVQLHADARRTREGTYDIRSVTGSEISFTNQTMAIRTSCLSARYAMRSATTNAVQLNQCSAIVSRLAARHPPATKMSSAGT